jgi:hypothetical protein
MPALLAFLIQSVSMRDYYINVAVLTKSPFKFSKSIFRREKEGEKEGGREKMTLSIMPIPYIQYCHTRLLVDVVQLNDTLDIYTQ